MNPKSPTETFSRLYLKRHLSVKEIQDLARKDIPDEVAKDLHYGIDCGKYAPKAFGSHFPKGWTYEMRCVESCPVAMQWVRKISTSFKNKSDYETVSAVGNAVKILAMASVYQSILDDDGL